MKYCVKCREQLHDDAAFCTRCGSAQAPPEAAPSPNQGQSIVQAEDKGGFLWGLLGFFVPIAGLILFLIWRQEKPKTAKAAGIGALISAAVGVVVVALYIILIVFFVIIGLSY